VRSQTWTATLFPDPEPGCKHHPTARPSRTFLPVFTSSVRVLAGASPRPRAGLREAWSDTQRRRSAQARRTEWARLPARECGAAAKVCQTCVCVCACVPGAPHTQQQRRRTACALVVAAPERSQHRGVGEHARTPGPKRSIIGSPCLGVCTHYGPTATHAPPGRATWRCSAQPARAAQWGVRGRVVTACPDELRGQYGGERSLLGRGPMD
jgi:hypothetical protein